MRRFLQGLGLGLLVAAVIMGIGTRGGGSMADESVVEKARELGMVFPQGTKTPREDMDTEDEDDTEAADKQADAAASGGAVGAGVGGGDGDSSIRTTDTPAPTVTPAPTEKPSKTKKPKKSSEPSESTDPDATPTPKKKDLPAGTVVEFEVRSGLLSSTVAKELYEAGIIDDLWEFDHYIEEHGLGHNIIVGTYELTVGDSYEKIAKIITHT